MSGVRKAQAGFTLVELAIVLMIIGLLVGGILRGQELLENTRVVSTVRQVQAYQGALISFRDAYGSLPGDVGNAVKRLPGCASTPGCVNGDNNNIIGELKMGIELLDIQTGAGVPRVETSMFWKHLSLAKLISGVNPSANPSQPEFGHTHPTSPFGGGFMVAQGRHHYMGTDNTTTAVWLALVNKLTGGNAYDPNGGNVLSPMIAKRIDDKLDDGMPDAGDVQSPDNGTCDNNVNGSSQRLYLTTEYKTCALIFKIF